MGAKHVAGKAKTVILGGFLLSIVAYVALLALLLSSCWYVAVLQLQCCCYVGDVQGCPTRSTASQGRRIKLYLLGC